MRAIAAWLENKQVRDAGVDALGLLSIRRAAAVEVASAACLSAVRASDFFGGYDTPTAREGGTHRGQAQTDPPLSSGRTHPDGSPAEPPIWSEEDAEAALPPAYVQKNKSKARDVQINDVCKARVHLTDAVANAGLHRPNPETVASAMRAAKRPRVA